MGNLIDTALTIIGLKSIPDRGQKSPETRLKSAGDARRLLQACLQEDGPRSLERALVKGCIDGNPPYDDARRKAEGRGWECNLNFGKGKGVMKRTGAPYFNLFARVQCFVECRTAHQPDNPDHDRWNSSIALRMHNLLQRWEDFSWNIQQISFWMRLHGIGFAFFDQDHDWRFRSIETGNVLVPKGTPSCLSGRVPYLFIRVPYRVHELWEKIKDEKAAKDAGWNVEGTRNAIKYGMRGMMGTPTSTDWFGRPWEEYQRILTNSELTASFTDGDVVNCSVMLLREYGGKISKFIFTEFEVAGEEVVRTDANRSSANQHFLYANPNCYGKYSEAIVPFFRNGGENDGTWHSVRGYAQDSFKHVEVENRLLCQAVNRAFLNSSVMLQFPNERARTVAQLKVIGTLVQLPAQSEIKQAFLQGGIDDVTLVQRLLASHLDNNIGIGTSRGMSRDDGRGETKTAREIDYTSANEGSISEAEITNYYAQSDAAYETVFKRISDTATSDEEAKRFQRECAEDGVPKEALQNMEYVRASRQNGYGSPEMAQIKFGQSKDVVAMLPEDGKQRWLEDYVTSIHGPQAARTFVPRRHIPDDQDWQAVMENQAISNGINPPLSAGQNDIIHLQKHFEHAEQVLTPVAQSLQQASGNAPPDPAPIEGALNFAQTMAEHVQEHLARVSQDPTRRAEGKLFEDQFKQLGDFSGELWRALRSARRANQVEAQQAQQATAIGALDAAKVESVRTSTALAAAKTQSSIRNAELKTTQQLANKQRKFEQEMRLKAQEARNGNARIPVPAEVVR